jgi:CheY-like chemotaxis protein
VVLGHEPVSAVEQTGLDISARERTTAGIPQGAEDAPAEQQRSEQIQLEAAETIGGLTRLWPLFGVAVLLFADSRDASARISLEALVMVLRCLIVDDSSAFLAAARGLLERQGVTVVGVASTGAEGLTRAAELRPDVVLLDIDLGGESGLELARRMHADGQLASLPVILISTHPREDYADLIAASPAVGFLPKIALSADAVRAVLDGSHAGP